LHRTTLTPVRVQDQNAGHTEEAAKMPSPVFTHQKNADGGFDSICASCHEIAASAPREEQLSTSELMHVCDPIRLYQVSHGRIIPQ
jgi:hypothetical protein